MSATLPGADAAPVLGIQHGLAFAPDGGAVETAEPVTARRYPLRRVNRNYRAESVVQMLADKGPMPIEILAKSVRQGWKTLQRDLGISKLEAFKLWSGLIVDLLPYTAPRLASLELNTDPATAGALGGGLAAHFLAASQFGRLAMLPAQEFGNTNDNPLISHDSDTARDRASAPPSVGDLLAQPALE